MLSQFIESGGTSTTSSATLIDKVVKSINSAKGNTEKELRRNLNAALSDILTMELHFAKHFNNFVKRMADTDFYS